MDIVTSILLSSLHFHNEIDGWEVSNDTGGVSIEFREHDISHNVALYHNSFGRTSVAVGHSWHYGNFKLSANVATGYDYDSEDLRFIPLMGYTFKFKNIEVEPFGNPHMVSMRIGIKL